MIGMHDNIITVIFFQTYKKAPAVFKGELYSTRLPNWSSWWNAPLKSPVLHVHKLHNVHKRNSAETIHVQYHREGTQAHLEALLARPPESDSHRAEAGWSSQQLLPKSIGAGQHRDNFESGQDPTDWTEHTYSFRHLSSTTLCGSVWRSAAKTTPQNNIQENN